MTVSVNVSATSLADPGYADAVTQIVTGHGLDPSEMILELTETEAILNIAAALENLTRLRIKGFGSAIDDYGVGYLVDAGAVANAVHGDQDRPLVRRCGRDRSEVPADGRAHDRSRASARAQDRG